MPVPLATLLISVNPGPTASALVARMTVPLSPTRNAVVLLAHCTAFSSVSAAEVAALVQSLRVGGETSCVQLAPPFNDCQMWPLLVTP